MTNVLLTVGETKKVQKTRLLALGITQNEIETVNKNKNSSATGLSPLFCASNTTERTNTDFGPVHVSLR